MANDLTDNPWILDTASANVIWPHKIFVDNMEFAEYTADTDTATIKDKNGRVIVAFNGDADLSIARTGKIGPISGLILATLTAGKVRVYIK